MDVHGEGWKIYSLYLTAGLENILEEVLTQCLFANVILQLIISAILSGAGLPSIHLSHAHRILCLWLRHGHGNPLRQDLVGVPRAQQSC